MENILHRERERKNENERENSDAACPIFLTLREDTHLLICFTISGSIDKSVVFSRTCSCSRALLQLRSILDGKVTRSRVTNQLVVSKSVSLSSRALHTRELYLESLRLAWQQRSSFHRYAYIYVCLTRHT